MILPNGAWTQDTADATHQSSQVLADFMAGYLPRDQYVFDFGCGNGFYCGHLQASGFITIGVDGYTLNNFQGLTFIEADLTKPLNLTSSIQPTGSVISLEVGEHLPKEAQEIYMQTVTKHCNGKLIFSWAEIGQPGLGHINCRDQQEVIDDVCSRGFVYMCDLTMQVRATIEENTSWFRRTLLIFERIKP